jgi:hypothetical protein
MTKNQRMYKDMGAFQLSNYWLVDLVNAILKRKYFRYYVLLKIITVRVY